MHFVQASRNSYELLTTYTRFPHGHIAAFFQLGSREHIPEPAPEAKQGRVFFMDDVHFPEALAEVQPSVDVPHDSVKHHVIPSAVSGGWNVGAFV
ncbi:MAG: hypothetical protein H6873_08920 [Hyphomicrobiaceae bacterium]|nr:hypothetical protein [Hyphomicrobiaceae bacterium]